MAELSGLSVKVPIRFSEKAQKDLYETCMAYKELAEMRGAENESLRELVRDMALNMGGCALHGNPLRLREFISRARELGIEVQA